MYTCQVKAQIFGNIRRNKFRIFNFPKGTLLACFPGA